MALTLLHLQSNTQVDGSIDGMTPEYLHVQGNANITLSSLPTFANTSDHFYFDNGLTEQMVDWLLEAAAQAVSWKGQEDVSLVGSLPAPSAAGLAFIPAIEANGAAGAVNP